MTNRDSLDLPNGLILEAWRRAGQSIPQRVQPSGTYSVRCAFPDNHKHGDRSPSAYLDPARNIYGCSCLNDPLTTRAFCEQLGIDFVQLCRDHGLIAEDDGATPAASKASTPPAVASEPATPSFTSDDASMVTLLAIKQAADRLPDDGEVRAYLDQRGLLGALAPQGEHPPLVGIVPTSCDPTEPPAVQEAVRVLGRDGGYRILAPLYSTDDGSLVAIQGRFVGEAPPLGDWRGGKKTRNRGRTHAAVFANPGGRALLEGSPDAPKSAVLCEGLTDWLAVSLHVGDGAAVLGIPGVSAIESVLSHDIDAERGSKKTEARPWVLACDDIVLGLDADSEGKKATSKACSILAAQGTKSLRVRVVDWADGAKDACATLASGGSESLVQCIATAPREGGPEPVRYLDLVALARDGIPPMTWLVEGWIAARDQVLVVGSPGGGKSTTMGSLAVACARGATEWCGLRIPHPLRVLVFDEEQGEMEAGRLYVRLAAHLGLAQKNLRVAAGSGILLSDPDGAARLEEEIRVFRPDLVLLDSATTVFGVADENNSAQVAAVYRVLHRLRDLYGVTFIVIHHRRKVSSNSNDTRVEKIDIARGSSAFGSQSSCVILAVAGSDPDTLDLHLIKRRGGTKTTLRTHYASNGPEGAITISGGGSIADAQEDFVEGVILDFLARRDASSAQQVEKIAAAAGISRSTTRRTMTRLKKAGILDNSVRGVWRIAKDALPARDNVIPIDGLDGDG